MGFFKNRFFVHVVIGLLLGAGFIVPAVWWLALVGVVIQLQLLAMQKTSAWWTMFAWTIKYALALSWFWSVYPLDWFPVSVTTNTQLLVIFVYWLSAAVWLGCGGAVLYAGYQLLHRLRLPLSMSLILVPGGWLIAELAGALIFSLVTYGAGATVGTQFSFGFVGYHLAQHAGLVLTAHLAGVYGMTILLVMLGMILVRLYSLRKNWLIVGILLLLVITDNLVVVPPTPLVEDTQTIAVVTTKLPAVPWGSSIDLQKRQELLATAYQAATRYEPAAIIFPEDSRFIPQAISASSTVTQLQRFLSTSSPMVIDSTRLVEPGVGVVQQAIHYQPGTEQLSLAHKRYLVPQGEFMPALYGAALFAVGSQPLTETLMSSFVYRPGSKVHQSSFPADVPGILFCFESVDPRGVARIVADREEDPPYIAHLVSHGWFHDPHTLQTQLESMLRVQAIWNDTYIVAASNQGPSYVVDPRGVVTPPQPLANGARWQVGIVTVPK